MPSLFAEDAIYCLIKVQAATSVRSPGVLLHLIGVEVFSFERAAEAFHDDMSKTVFDKTRRVDDATIAKIHERPRHQGETPAIAPRNEIFLPERLFHFIPSFARSQHKAP